LISATKVKLVAFEKEHAGNTLAWVNDLEIATAVNRIKPVTEAEHQGWYQNITTRPDCYMFAVVDVAGKHFGNVWLFDVDNYHRKAEVRILIGDKSAQGKGVGTEALQLISRFAFEMANLHKLYAYVLETNPRAKRSFEKAGFSQEGVLRSDRFSAGKFVDVYVLGLVNPN
jgi:RimJ/RimL family protein N-acetyltransferase